jgi:hypothetical protein
MNEAEPGDLRTCQCVDQPLGQVVKTVIAHLPGTAVERAVYARMRK